MYYYWWLIAVSLYLGILLLYVSLTYIITEGNNRATAADGVFFGVASIVTLSIVPLIKVNIYRDPN